MRLPTESVSIMDVTARDGFQMEKAWIPTEEKIGVINAVLASGVRRIEATSFVSPKAVPQLSDADEVLAGIDRPKGAAVTVLVPNLRGAELALRSEVDEVTVVVSVSEAHNRSNVRRSVRESVAQIGEIVNLLEPAGKRVNVGLATSFVCVFEGVIPVRKVIDVISALSGAPSGGALASFVLSDTTGMANPRQVHDYVKAVKERFPRHHFGLHLHNTRGMGLANILAGYQAGIRSFDAAVGGIGGCPFSPGATGNVCTEDLVHMFHEMGIETGIEVDKLIRTAKGLEALLGYPLPGYLMRAGTSPTSRDADLGETGEVGTGER